MTTNATAQRHCLDKEFPGKIPLHLVLDNYGIHTHANVKAWLQFLQVWNQDPKPFVWTATVESILAKLSGCRQTLEQIQPGYTAPPQRRKRKLSS